ncbi:MAG TPA: FGGY family carbohydrate kinase [Acidimicrobiales bacterium]|nr:FGGY family carbohydrate kinase [Acidimicrobiales bacterium]
MDLVVGVDIATAHVRAVAADAAGRVHAKASSSLPAPRSPRPGWSEQDAGGWWPAVAAVLREVTGQLRLGAGGRVVAVSVCATSGTVVALDSGGQPIGPALTYADQRAVAEADVAHAAAADRWAGLGLRIQASFGLPKWAWLVSGAGKGGGGGGAGSRPVTRLAHASDVVVRQLVGAAGGDAVPTDWSHALKSGYDPLRREWASEAMAALGIPIGLLPEVHRPTERAGRVRGDTSAVTGLPAGCEVRLGMTDACASQLAAGAGEPGRFVSVLGSTLVLKGASQDLVVDPSGAVYSHRHPDGWWLPGGASSTGAAALAAGFPGRDTGELDSTADRRGPASCVVYPLVGRGERFPFVAPDAEGFVLGEPTDEADRVRATFEGVAFVERLAYERLAALGARAQPPVVVTGGGSGSAIWNRIRATVLGVPVLAAPEATTALGGCILAAAGTLHPDLSTATTAMSAPGEQVDPVPAENDALEASYRRFRDEMVDRGWITG